MKGTNARQEIAIARRKSIGWMHYALAAFLITRCARFVLPMKIGYYKSKKGRHRQVCRMDKYGFLGFDQTSARGAAQLGILWF